MTNITEHETNLSSNDNTSNGVTGPAHSARNPDGTIKLSKHQEQIIDKIIRMIASKLDTVISVLSESDADDEELATTLLSEFAEAKALFDELGLSGQDFSKALSMRILHPPNLAVIMAAVRKSTKKRKQDLFKDSTRLNQVIDRLRHITGN